MVIYFSGTGNSEFAAKVIAMQIEDESIDLFHKIRNNDYSQMVSVKPWVVVVPTYAWRIPRIVAKWFRKAILTGNRKVYFVMTCGDDIGDAGRYAKKLCDEREMEFMGCERVIMPENYIALFDTPDRETSIEIIKKAQDEIDDISSKIKSGARLMGLKISIADILKSSIVNWLFYPFFVKAGKFRVTDKCIGCGKCEKLCVMNNITCNEGKPEWGRKCTHCMACIGRCPAKAIEYGKASEKRVKYSFPWE